jgi:hypothetical protein
VGKQAIRFFLSYSKAVPRIGWGFHGPTNGKTDPKERLKENLKNLRRDVDELVQLAQDLKTDADKTNQTDVLSITLIHKTEEIEKLARQIKSLARAS